MADYFEVSSVREDRNGQKRGNGGSKFAAAKAALDKKENTNGAA